MSENQLNPAPDSEALAAAAEDLPSLVESVGQLRQELAVARDKITNLEQALTSSRRIGMAIGILMARHKITDEQAFELLCAASSSSHRKVRHIAEDVIGVGELTLPHGLHRTHARDAKAEAAEGG